MTKEDSSKSPRSYRQSFSIESLLDAFACCRKNKSFKRDVIEFELDLGTNLVELARELDNHTYEIGRYKQFYVYEPKKRQIECLPYRDRVVLMALCRNILEPAFDGRLLDCNVACRGGKGIMYAIEMLEDILQGHFEKHGTSGWFLKCDIQKYFASINHEVLYGLLCKFDFDADTMKLLRKIIKSHNANTGTGLPIGNQTSQWLALLMLHPVDVLISKELGLNYIRYMDDFILIHHDKRVLLDALDRIKALLSRLKLVLNNKTQIIPMSQGVDFLGFRHRLDQFGRVERPLRQQAQNRLRRNLRELMHRYKCGKIDANFVEVRLCCYLSFMLHSKAAVQYYRRTIAKSKDKKLIQKIIANSRIDILREKLQKPQ